MKKVTLAPTGRHDFIHLNRPVLVLVLFLLVLLHTDSMKSENRTRVYFVKKGVISRNISID